MYLKNVKYIGPKTIEILNANQIYTPRDLLLCFPKKYHIYQVDDKNIFSGEAVCFKCQIASRPVLIKSRGNSRAFVFYILIGNQKYKCIIFSGDFLKYKLQVGLPLICYGKYKLKDKEFSISTIFFDDFVCKIELDYGFKEVKNKLISNAVLACIKEGVLVEETLPQEYILKYRLLDKNTLIQMAHFPTSIEDCIKTKRRIRYEDFFWYAASLEILKLSRGFEHKEPKIFDDQKIKNIVDLLPYQLTNDQNKAIEVILDDLKSIKPMNRLVEGDVGCGKSIVAFMASIAVIEAGYQIALMAPTEILAWQHYNNFKKQFPNYQVEILTSSTKEKEREDILYRLVHQRVDMIIGTHTLIQDYVIFSRLGLVIIDEQHRFGVNQRKTLLEKWKGVDALYLTATPIPRTLGLTTFGDLDLTLIKQMPLNRKKIITKIVPKDGLNALGRVLQRHLIMEEQIYIVVPFIEENETLDYMDIESALEIFKELLPEARMDILHGKMRPKEKDVIMNQFKTHQLDCLISTTVIEVGVDVANATVMVILDAERYGLSQLHQLRGRVGRGKLQSYCYLVSRKEETERLKILEQTTDGFIIAEEDFKLRGPGDYLGEEQSGFDNLHIDFSSKDAIIWKCAMEDSKEYVAKCFNGEVIDEKISQLIEQSQLKKAKIN
ncbi:MAG: ATP-dependent DNA helicase RecG [Anaeroplasmataceae bacterium]|nr:ATP-dependent DNA helicase RecG [Anaeroplasmataceae bacterium]